MNQNYINNDQNILKAEQEIIAHILNNGNYVEDIYIKVVPNDFVNYKHRVIYKILIEFKEKEKPIEILTLLDYIKHNPELNYEDFQKTILEIDENYLYQENIDALIDLLKNNTINRELNDFATDISSTNINSLNYNEKLNQFGQRLVDIGNIKKTNDIKSMNEIVEIYSKMLDEKAKNATGFVTGTTSGFNSIDKITNGFQPGDLIILAARPGIGKTTLAINFLVNAAKWINDNVSQNKNDLDRPDVVLMFSLEMGKEQICHRIIRQESSVDFDSARMDKLSETEKTAISVAITNTTTFKILIDDSSSISIMDIQSRIKQVYSTYNIKLVVIDYLQLVKGNKSSQANRQQEVAEISRTLKSLARQYSTPIISLAQLSRKIEERKFESRKPMLSDLRESGAIEQDADLVCFINYKEENIDESNKTNFSENVMVDFIIAKNRNGSTASIDMMFAKPFSKFFEVRN